MAEVVLVLVTLAQVVSAAMPRMTATSVVPVCRPDTDCKLTSYTPQEFYYDVNGEQVIISFHDEKHFKVWCDSSMFTETPSAADEQALPALPAPAAVDRVEFSGCRLPNSSFPAAMAALNINATKVLELTINENDTALQRHHFTGLKLPSLVINGVGLPTEEDFLDDVRGLQMLQLYRVRLSEKAQLNLPVTLTKLFLNDALIAPLASLQWLERLRSLSVLTLIHEDKGALLTPPLMHQFPNLTDVLLQVPLKIPSLWLNGSALKTLSLNDCGLKDLPADMFHGVNLTSLSMTRNNLGSPPPGLITRQRWLRYLDVTRSALSGEELVKLVSSLEFLEELRANHNPLGSLCGGSGFVVRALSLLPHSLRRLHLRGTNATQVCTDWVEDDPALEYIDLSLNSIETLTYESLDMIRSPRRLAGVAGEAGEVQLVLADNPLRDVDVRARHVAACRAAPRPLDPGLLARAPVRLFLSGLLCDCLNARFRELVAECPLVRLEPTPCLPPPHPAQPARASSDEPRDFLDYLPEKLLCECPADYNFSVPGCSCGKRLQDNATVVECSGTVGDARWPPSARARPLALAAAGAGLTAIPKAQFVELNATNNSISSLREEDISDTLLILDLRNNKIEHISVETARRLGSAGPGGRPRRIWLAGNALACSCDDRDAIESLMSARVQAQVRDWRELRCRDGRELSALAPSELCLDPRVPAALAVAGVVLALAVAAPFALRWALPRLKQFLFDRQMCLGWVLRAHDDPDDPTKTHDVFISYAYADRKLAMKLRQWLDDKGFSTVEHSRDWLAGVPVDEHIVNSVRCARRTLLLVSDSFADSVWGLQEFHAAHAHALEKGSARVIPVRCHLSALHTLPEDLRLYLYNNTYLSYDDPEFWSKLVRVMPPRRGAPRAPASAKEPPLAAHFVAPAAC